MLDQESTLHFKSRLRERADQLRGEVQEAMARTSEESPAQIAERARDMEDDSFATLIVDTNLAEVERDVDELRLIDSALQRLSDGTYGICVDCGQEIPSLRLEAEPTAARCIKDQELYEKTHASTPTPRL
jgi:RNA polymerase-binding protein DksA